MADQSAVHDEADSAADTQPEQSVPLFPHVHPPDDAASGSPEQSAVYAVAVLGLALNLTLVSLILAQRHTRRLTSAFLIHSAFLNLLMSGFAFAFAGALSSEGVSSGSCRSLTIGYIVFQTIWVFNLIPTVCCEIFYLDSGSGRQAGGSACCAALGICLVYVCSAILHLGPTLIGSNFEWRAQKTRCMFLHGQSKNYTVYLMWIVIVTVALAGTGFLLVTFRRAIDSSMRSRIRARIPGRAALRASGPLDFVSSDATLAERLGHLAALKANRQKVLCGICGIFALCWYPLYLLILSDPLYKAPEPLYHLFTVLGFAKTVLEPLAIAACDRSIGRQTTMRLLPCTRRLGYVSESEIDAMLAAAASAGCPERSDSTSAIASGSSAIAVAPPPPPPPQRQWIVRPRNIGDTPPASDLMNPSPMSL